MEGDLYHRRAHDEKQRERRGDTLILRDLPVCSPPLGVSGRCDVVEFHADLQGVPLRGEDGLWRPYPAEYKRGAPPKSHSADELQLCCPIPEGALFYGETRRRTAAPFTQELRGQVRDMPAETHRHARRGYTPRVKPSKACSARSLEELCMTALLRERTAGAYLRRAMEAEP